MEISVIIQQGQAMQSKIRTGDTIVAIATPPGEGAISVVRLSGRDAIVVADRIFKGRTPLLSAAGYTIHHGFVIDEDGKEVDEVLISVFIAPHSYTGENLIEIGCHGGTVTSARVLAASQRAGARQADPGEFTKRAFLNGKIDLSQAEAVADLISARSSRAQEMSLAQLGGSLSKRVKLLKQSLLETCSLLEIDLDFSEDGISVIPVTEIRSRLKQSISDLRGLLSTYETGKIVREGVRAVIVGPPNAGKSCIFNVLLGRDRAIVSEIPGTTRDYIEESLTIDGVLFQLVDTAGVRETNDIVEKQGVSRSQELLRTGDVVLAVIDCLSPPDQGLFRSLVGSSNRVVLAINKIDLLENGAEPEWLPGVPINTKIPVSALNGQGIDTLRVALLSAMQLSGDVRESSGAVTNRRHAEVLGRALGSAELALSSLEKGLTNEFIALDARAAISAMTEITGEITSEDVLNGIFSRFCIGK